MKERKLWWWSKHQFCSNFVTVYNAHEFCCCGGVTVVFLFLQSEANTTAMFGKLMTIASKYTQHICLYINEYFLKPTGFTMCNLSCSHSQRISQTQAKLRTLWRSLIRFWVKMRNYVFSLSNSSAPPAHVNRLNSVWWV